MLMALGMFPFDLPLLAYEELQRRTDWRHARNPRVGARDATQFTGPGDDTINLSGTAYAELCAGRASLDELRRMADGGEARSLVDGAGYIYGAFVITALDEKHKAILPDGTPLRIDFSLDLLRVDVEPRA
nr:phage tail protein [uncultured Sphingomonas sp.]